MTKSDFEHSIDYAYERFLDEIADLAKRHKLDDDEAFEIVNYRLGSDVGEALEEWLVDDD